MFVHNCSSHKSIHTHTVVVDTLLGELIFAPNKGGAKGGGKGNNGDYADLTYSAFRRDGTI